MTQLKKFWANINTIETLDFSNNTLLEELNVENNTTLTTLDVSQNNLLDSLDLSNCAISSVDISQMTQLTSFDASDNQITVIDFSNNPLIYEAYLSNNPLVSIDMSNQSALEFFDAFNAELTYLNIQNGNNNNLDYFDITGNPNLTCVIVDNVNDAQTSLTDVDAQVRFSETFCRYTSIPDAYFEAAISYLDDIPGDGQVPTANIEVATDVDIADSQIQNLTGLQDFIALEDLDAYDNPFTEIDLSQNVNLKTLVIYSGVFTSLDVSANTLLTSLDVSNNSQLTSLNVQNTNNLNVTTFNATNTPSLTCILVDNASYSSGAWANIDAQTSFNEIYCDYTAIPDANFEAALEALGYDDISGDLQVPTSFIENVTSLNVNNENISNASGLEDFTALEELYIRNNNLTDLDVSSLLHLERLWALDNNITALDLSNNVLLTDLRVENNSLSSIDLSYHPDLNILQIENNQLEELDLSNNTLLTRVRVDDNNLETLDLSNLSILAEFKATSNNLTYVNLQNGNETALTNFDLRFNPDLTCVLVDDANHSATEWTNIDSQVIFSETTCRYTAIPDSDFEAILGTLGYDDVVNDNQVPTDLIENVISLDLSGNFPLSIIDLTGIKDFINLESLDVSGHSISILDLSENTKLKTLDCSSNSITSLNLSGLTDLNELNVGQNQLTDLDLDTNLALTTLHCEINQLTSLDLSHLTMLTLFDGNTNNLTSLNMANGNNDNFILFNAISNADLTCIKVDNVENSNMDWTLIDSQTSFTDAYCRYTAVPDAAFEAALEALGYDDITGDQQVPTALIEDVTTLDIDLLGISNLSGIEDFTNLEVLDVSLNNLTDLDVSDNLKLQNLDCSGNTDLNTLDVSANTLLTQLYTSTNGMNQLDVSNNTALIVLDIQNNEFTSVDLTNNSVLQVVYLNDNLLTSVDVRNGNNEAIYVFNTTNNPDLFCVLVDNATDSTTEWTDIDAQTSFSETYCRYTSISDANFEAALGTLGYDDVPSDGQVPTALIEAVASLDVSNQNIATLTGIKDFVVLELLTVTSNNLTSLDLDGLTELLEVKAALNNLTSIDLGPSTSLYFADIEDNVNLTSIDVSNNTGLDDLSIQNCTALETITFGANANLRELSAQNSGLTSLDTSNLTDLELLFLSNTQIESLDLSANTMLSVFSMTNTPIESLNLKNGNNDNIVSIDLLGNPNLTCVLVDNATDSTNDWTDVDAQTSFSETSCTTDFSLVLKVFLQGAALNPNTGEDNLMRDDLRVAELIPTASPYTDGLTCDASVFNATGNDAIVDWVWIELRDATDNTVVSYSQSALLQRDGDVVDVDGTSALDFSTTDDTYYVAIHHRNHLGIMTSLAIDFSSGNASIDFTDTSNPMTYGTEAQTTIGMPGETYGMWSGDADGDGILNYNNDGNSILFEVLFDPTNTSFSSLYNGANDYYSGDMDLNGNASFQADLNNLLFNILFHPSNTSFSSLYSIQEQLPDNSSLSRKALDNEQLERRAYIAQKLQDLQNQINNN